MEVNFMEVKIAHACSTSTYSLQI